jgi:hypothetical protein
MHTVGLSCMKSSLKTARGRISNSNSSEPLDGVGKDFGREKQYYDRLLIVRLLESNTVIVSPVLPVAICLIVESNLQRRSDSCQLAGQQIPYTRSGKPHSPRRLCGTVTATDSDSLQCTADSAQSVAETGHRGPWSPGPRA